MAFDTQIADGLGALGIKASADQISRLDAYVLLLARWNRVYNLTAVRNARDMVSRHILDSASVCHALNGHRVADVGTGAGSPGIPLAILNPDSVFVLIDASAKRTRFLEQAKIELALPQIAIVRERVETYRPRDLFTTAISRAFSSTRDFVDNAGHLLAPDGRLLAMKGRLQSEPADTLANGWRIETTERLNVPGIEGMRHLLIIVCDPPG